MLWNSSWAAGGDCRWRSQEGHRCINKSYQTRWRSFYMYSPVSFNMYTKCHLMNKNDCKVYIKWPVKILQCTYLKLPSLFAVWFFWNFPINHIIWKHWSFQIINDHHFSYLHIYMEKMNFCGSLCALLEYFRENRLSQFQENSFVMRHFYKIILF